MSNCGSINDLEEKLACEENNMGGNNLELSEQNVSIDMHRDLHMTSVMFTVGGVAGLIFVVAFCYGAWRLCRNSMREEAARLRQGAGEIPFNKRNPA